MAGCPLLAECLLPTPKPDVMNARTLVPLCTATLTFFVGLHAYGQSCGGSVTHAGETYATVQVGNQCWLAENIRSSMAKDGATIPLLIQCNP